MANVIVIGAQWGDEGKAKIVDLLAEKADMVIRCQGGCNAGHTVTHQGEVFKFHLIPSGLLYPDTVCVIGPGTVIDPDILFREITQMEAKGYTTRHLKISDRAHITLPYHVTLDKVQEASRDEQQHAGKIGTTGKGIGPTYMDKVGRMGLRVGDLYESDAHLHERLLHLHTQKSQLLPDMETVSSLFETCKRYAEQLSPYVTDTIPLVHEAVTANQNILFEGAQGTLLDVDYGTYPFVTSSNATAGGACTGSGVGPSRIDHVIGVMKAYTTRVGSGPFPTELNDAMGRHFQEVGQEFGTTTGRIRRCGWFDGVIGRYSIQVNGLDSLAITKLDVLDGLDYIKLCVAYRHRKTGEHVTHFPAQINTLSELEPIYETCPGWSESIRHVRRYDELPAEARHYLERLATLLGVNISVISVGPDRQETILLSDPMKTPRPIRYKPCLA